MHYHLEILMPPTNDVEKAVSEIMAPFNEQPDGEDEDTRHAFWDWWVIGGRWSGTKVERRIGDEGMKAFREELANRKVTVSGLQWGKHELQPASQIPMVDALWNEMFPNSGIAQCPLFKHAQVSRELDVCSLSDLPSDLTASRLIIAGPAYDDPTKMRATHMIEDSVWNGVTWVSTTWNGVVKTAIDEYIAKAEGYADDYKAKNQPKNDWLLVTVDYHS